MLMFIIFVLPVAAVYWLFKLLAILLFVLVVPVNALVDFFISLFQGFSGILHDVELLMSDRRKVIITKVNDFALKYWFNDKDIKLMNEWDKKKK